jgi:starch synthase
VTPLGEPIDRRAKPVRLAGRTPRLRVLMVSAEASPWAKTGGLADVLAGLPDALDRLGHHSTVVLPRYRGVTLPDVQSTPAEVRVGSRTHRIQYHTAALSSKRRVVFVDSPSHFDREGYYNVGGHDYGDNAERFALLSTAALDFAERDAGGPPDIVHVHDWQAAFAPVALRADPPRWPRLTGAGLVLTIHNLAYQGNFPPELVPAVGLPWSVYSVEGGEFWGRFSFLKAGVNACDLVTTVSPTYAAETLRPEFGCGLDGVLAARRDAYVGILNGIDTRAWDPASDEWLPARFDADHLHGKRECKRALLQRFGLPVGDDAMARPAVGMVSRLVDQKGFDLVVAASRSLVMLDALWVVAGAGEERFERPLRQLAAEFPARVGVFIGFDERLAHLIEAGSDIFLMPSRFEPCGLNQMYSLRYGTVPVVRAVGGLDDTVCAYSPRAVRANGFKFSEATPEAIVRAMRQAIRVYHDRGAWERLMRQGMAEDHSWEASAREYVKVYKRARMHAAERQGGAVPGERKG